MLAARPLQTFFSPRQQWISNRSIDLLTHTAAARRALKTSITLLKGARLSGVFQAWKHGHVPQYHAYLAPQSYNTSMPILENRLLQIAVVGSPVSLSRPPLLVRLPTLASSSVWCIVFVEFQLLHRLCSNPRMAPLAITPLSGCPDLV